MHPARDRVLSVAAVVLDDDGHPVEQYTTLLNPGVDPGPVHVHGLTPALLAGAPRFDDVAEELGAVLAGRTLVAHNAGFDLSFLTAEAGRARVRLPVERSLCTLEYAGRLHLPTPALTLAALAAHFEVPQHAAHQALDDALVLAGVLRGLDRVAAERGVRPVVREAAEMTADPATGMLAPRRWTDALSAPRPWRPAGRYRRGGALVQGMEVVFTPEVDLDPIDLAADLVAAGVYVAERLSSRTSLAVCDDPHRERGRAGIARRRGLEVIGTARLRELLAEVRPGRPTGAPAAVADGQDTLF